MPPPKKESLWREDLQSGGNPRTTTPTGLEPKELATVSKTSGIIDPYQLYGVQENLEKKIIELLSPKKWRNIEKLGRLAVPDSEISRDVPSSNRRCSATIPWKALQILISKMESFKRC